MQNASQLENAYETLKDSAGSAMKEQESYVQSLSGKINALKESLTGISIQLIDSDEFKGLVDGATTGVQAVSKLIDTFGAFPSTVTAVVGAMTVLNSKFRENSDVQLKLMFPSYSKISESLKQVEQRIITYRNTQLKSIEINRAFASGVQGSSVSLQGLSTELIKTQGKAILATAGLVSMRVATIALQTAMSMGLSLAISGAISLITKWIGSIETAEEKAENLAEASKSLATAMTENKDNSKLLSDYEKIKKQIDDISTTEEERNSLNQELNSIKSQLENMDNQAYAILNNQNLSLERQLELLKHINDEKMREKALELEKSMGKQSETEAMVKDIEIYSNTIKNLQDALSKGDGQGVAKILGIGKDFDDAKNAIDDYKTKIEQLMADIDIWNSNVKMLKDNGLGSDLSYVELDDSLRETLNVMLEVIDTTEDLNNAISGSGDSADNSSQKLSNLSEIYATLGYSAEDAKDRIEELNGMSYENQLGSVVQDATKAYSECIDTVADLYDLLKDINEEGGLTPSLISEIASSFPEIGAAVTDLESVQDFIQSKITATMQKQQEAYEIMIGNDASYYSAKLANNEEFEQLINDSINSIVGMQESGYNIDLSNFATLNELKNGIQNQFGEAQAQSIEGILDMYNAAYTFDSQNFADLQSMKQGYMNQLIPAIANWIAQFTGGNAEGYTKDLSSFNDLTEMKAYAISQLSAKMAELQSQWSKVIDNYNSAVQDAYANAKGDKAMELESHALRQVRPIGEKINAISSQISTIDKVFGGLQSKLNTYEANFKGSSFGGNISDSGKNSGNKGSSSSKEKEVADLEDMTNRYIDLENAITKVENELSLLHTEMENADDEERIKLLQKEITLLGDKRKALENLRAEQQKELSELKTQLSNNGFKFNSTGDITNINSQLETLRQRANSLSGEAKENAQDAVKNIADIVERYNDLLLNEIPETTDAIADIKNEIIDAQKEIADVLAKQRDEYIDNLEKENDALKKSLDERKKMLQQSYDEEDYEDNLAEYQNKINELESELSNALRVGDSELIKSIREQLAQAQKEMSDYIRDQERDAAIDRIDSEMDALDEDLEAKIEEINNKLSDEQLLEMVKQGVTDLSSTLDNITNSTKSVKTAFASIGTIITDNWINNLDLFIDKLKSINMNMPTISLATTGEIATRSASGISLRGGDIIVEGNMTEDVLPKVKRMIEDSNNRLVRQLNSVLGRN